MQYNSGQNIFIMRGRLIVCSTFKPRLKARCPHSSNCIPHGDTPFHFEFFNQCKVYSLNPPISPQRLVCKNEFLVGGLFKERVYSRGAYFKLWHFPQG